MITVTEQAKDLFLDVVNPAGTILRLDPIVDEATGESQISISTGAPQDDDQVVERNGERVLHIAAPVSEALDGSKLDLVETPEGPAIGLQTPNVETLTDDS